MDGRIDEPAGNPSTGHGDAGPIPAISELPPLRARTRTEASNVARLVEMLPRYGWAVNREVVVYGQARDGRLKRYRVDLMVRHDDLPGIAGAIEVKASVGYPWSDQHGDKTCNLADAVKQASDYVGCRCLATGQVIEWAAVYPVRALHRCHDSSSKPRWITDEYTNLRRELHWLGGVLELGSKHLKVHPLFHHPRQGLTLGYLDRHVIWSEAHGLRENGKPMLCGRRQEGGIRR